MESKKKGIALTAMGLLVAYKPTTYIELAVAGAVLIIAIYAINRQAVIDKGDKNETKTDNTGAAIKPTSL